MFFFYLKKVGNLMAPQSTTCKKVEDGMASILVNRNYFSDISYVQYLLQVIRYFKLIFSLFHW